MSGQFKFRDQMTPDERHEDSIRGIIYTSVEDAKYGIAHASKKLLEDALAREKTQSKRVSLIRMIEARLRKLEAMQNAKNVTSSADQKHGA